MSGIRQKGRETVGGKGNRKDLKRSRTNDDNKGYTKEKINSNCGKNTDI